MNLVRGLTTKKDVEKPKKLAVCRSSFVSNDLKVSFSLK
jgi:hypothetical protein